MGVILDLPPPPSSTALAGDTPTGGRAYSSCQTMLQSYPSSLQSGIRYIYTVIKSIIHMVLAHLQTRMWIIQLLAVWPWECLIHCRAVVITVML